MSLPATYKPSPLSLGSPRTSPFRRPESPSNQLHRPTSPASSTTTPRATTPTTSPTKPYQPILASPSKLQSSSTPPFHHNPQPEWSPRGLTPTIRDHPPSPTRSTSSSTATAVPTANNNFRSLQPTSTSTTAAAPSFTQLPPQILNQLRQTFSCLDRSSTGAISRADVAATLADLGLPSSAADVSPFFPPGSAQSLPLAQFLSSLAIPLSQVSREEELLNAFGAFDERDSGEVDAELLRDALVHTGGEFALSEREVEKALEGFTGRKAFGKGGGGGERGEVFRYREWVGGVLGGGEEGKAVATK